MSNVWIFSQTQIWKKDRKKNSKIRSLFCLQHIEHVSLRHTQTECKKYKIKHLTSNKLTCSRRYHERVRHTKHVSGWIEYIAAWEQCLQFAMPIVCLLRVVWRYFRKWANLKAEIPRDRESMLRKIEKAKLHAQKIATTKRTNHIERV